MSSEKLLLKIDAVKKFLWIVIFATLPLNYLVPSSLAYLLIFLQLPSLITKGSRRLIKAAAAIFLIWLLPYVAGAEFTWHEATRIWPFLFYVFLAAGTLGKETEDKCRSYFLFSCIFISFIAFVQHLTGKPDFSFDGIKPIPGSDGYFHGCGFFSRHHVLSPFLTFALFSLPFQKYQNKWKVLAGAALILGLVSTGSRSAYLLILVFFAFITFFYTGLLKPKRILAGFILLVIIALLIPGVRNRIQTSFDPNLDSNTQRMKILKVNYHMLLDTGPFGIGFGNYPKKSPDYFKKLDFSFHKSNSSGSHNDLVQLIIELGWLGSLAFLSIMFFSLLRLWRFQQSLPEIRINFMLLGVYLFIGQFHNLIQFQGISLCLVLFFAVTENTLKKTLEDSNFILASRK